MTSLPAVEAVLALSLGLVIVWLLPNTQQWMSLHEVANHPAQAPLRWHWMRRAYALVVGAAFGLSLLCCIASASSCTFSSKAMSVYLRFLIGGTIKTCALVFSFNWLIDPYGIWHDGKIAHMNVLKPRSLLINDCMRLVCLSAQLFERSFLAPHADVGLDSQAGARTAGVQFRDE
ncbi:MAG: hypothetical protein IPJ25_13695 [Rhodocyclaceae bacterium]|nr:hypothetical protein [Rhodocyclaceae bacterium]